MLIRKALTRMVLVLVSASTTIPPVPARAQVDSAHFVAGRTFLAQGRFVDAAREFRTAVERDSTNAVAWNALGSTLIRLDAFQEALEAQDRALHLDATRSGFWFNRALVYAELGRFDATVTDLTAALGLRPGFAPAHTERGAAYALLGRSREAHAEWSRAWALDSNYIWTQFYKGLQLIAEGNFALAASALDAVAAREGLLSAHLWRWVAHRRSGRSAPQLVVTEPRWPAPIAAFLNGTSSAADLVRAARDSALSIDERRLASAWFFIAHKRLAERDSGGALAALEAAAFAKAPALAEAFAAREELKRLRSSRDARR